jgi:NADH dehydrogenase
MAERIFLAMDVKRAVVPIPVTLLRPLVALLQRVLPNPPVTTSLLDLLAVDNTVADNALFSVFRIEPTPFAPEELRYLKVFTAGDAVRSMFGR